MTNPPARACACGGLDRFAAALAVAAPAEARVQALREILADLLPVPEPPPRHVDARGWPIFGTEPRRSGGWVELPDD